MSLLMDAEFGAIKLRRSHLSRQVKLRLAAGGEITISMPKRTPLYVAKQLLEQSRPNLRKNLQHIHTTSQQYRHGDTIGKSHRLIIEVSYEGVTHAKLQGTVLLVTLTDEMSHEEPAAQEVIKQGIEKALRAQAKAYLPRQIRQLADTYGFEYEGLRFSSAGTRWGSCSSTGTISLNIWLMQLPFELIDYVLVHELCHTKQMNHSPAFWQLVETACPHYKMYRKALKEFHPYA